MDKGTLALNALQVLMDIAIENLINMGKVERCSQAAGKSLSTSEPASADSFGDCLECYLRHRTGETD